MIPASAKNCTPSREQFAILPFSIIQALSGSVTRSGIVVYCALAVHADPSGHCWPGRARLGEITGLNERQVSLATAELEKTGLLRKVYGDRGRVDYWLLPVSPRPIPPVVEDTPPLPPVAPRTEQGTDQKEQREVSPPALPEPTVVPPNGAHSEERKKAPVIPLPSKTALPEVWELPEDWRAWAEAQRPDLENLESVATSFHLYHLSKGTRSACWIAEWKRWVIRERALKKPATPPSRYAPLTGAQKPVPAAVQAALQQSEERRLEMLRRNGIDPKTGLKLGVGIG